MRGSGRWRRRGRSTPRTGKDITPVNAVMLSQLGLATFGAKPALTPFVLT